MTTEKFLKSQLDELQKFHPAYGGGLSIHLPMALTALYRLGADAQRLADFFETGKSHLKPFPKANELFNFQTAKDHLGMEKYYLEYREFFKASISEEGHPAVLKKWLPILAPGITAHAFHSLIRLAYAIDIQHLEDIASSIAYWADMYKALGEGISNAIPEKNLGTFLNQIQSAPEFDVSQLPDALIHIKMAEVAKRPLFKKVLGALKVETGTLGTLADIASRWYLCTGDFTALHGVTSCHALSLLLPFTGDQEQLIRYYWQAFCAAYLTVPTRTLYQETNKFNEYGILPSWEVIRSEALLKRDEHDIKLVYSCWVEKDRYPSLIYQKMASDRLGLTVGFWEKTTAKC